MMPVCQQFRLPTISEIAKRIKRDRHKVQYVIRSRNITPAGIAGNTSVYSEDDVVFIESEIRRIEEDRKAVIHA